MLGILTGQRDEITAHLICFYKKSGHTETPGRKNQKEKAHPDGCAFLVGEAGLEPARPQ